MTEALLVVGVRFRRSCEECAKCSGTPQTLLQAQHSMYWPSCAGDVAGGVLEGLPENVYEIRLRVQEAPEADPDDALHQADLQHFQRQVRQENCHPVGQREHGVWDQLSDASLTEEIAAQSVDDTSVTILLDLFPSDVPVI